MIANLYGGHAAHTRHARPPAVSARGIAGLPRDKLPARPNEPAGHSGHLQARIGSRTAMPADACSMTWFDRIGIAEFGAPRRRPLAAVRQEPAGRPQ